MTFDPFICDHCYGEYGHINGCEAASPTEPIDLARETIKSPNHTTSKGET